MTRRKSLMAALLAASALVFDVAVVQAAIHPGSATIVNVDVTVRGVSHPKNTGGATAWCPKGQLVIGGGAYFHQPGQGFDSRLNALIGSSAPRQDGRGWFASGLNWWLGHDLLLRVIAYCRPEGALAGMTFLSLDVNVSPNSYWELHWSCPTGDLVLTGGAYWHRPAFAASETWYVAYVQESSPSPTGDGWWAAGFNDDNTQSYALHMTALCLPAASLSGRSIVTADLPFNGASVAERNVTCPAGKSVTAAGVRWRTAGGWATPAQSGFLRGTAPVSGGSKFWAGAQQRATTSASLRLTAVCLPD